MFVSSVLWDHRGCDFGCTSKGPNIKLVSTVRSQGHSESLVLCFCRSRVPSQLEVSGPFVNSATLLSRELFLPTGGCRRHFRGWDSCSLLPAWLCRQKGNHNLHYSDFGLRYLTVAGSRVDPAFVDVMTLFARECL